MDYHLQDLVDVAKFQDLLDSLNEATKFPTAFIDLKDNILTASGFQNICTQFHRSHSVGALEPQPSDRHICDRLQRDNPSVVFRCANGLVEFAIPILLGGKHLASVFGGQIFLEPPDLGRFRHQAHIDGFEEAVYLEAIAQVPVVPQAQLKRNLNLVQKVAELIGETGLKSLHEIETRAALRKSEERFQTFFQNVPYTVVINRLSDGAYVAVNPTFEKMSGYSAAEALGKTASDLRLIKSDQEQEIIDRLTREKLVTNLPITTFNRQGELRYILYSSAVIHWDNEPCVITTTVDLTEMQRSEDALKEREAILQTITMSARDAIVMVDENGKVSFWNKAAEQIFGWPEAEILGCDLHLLLDPETQQLASHIGLQMFAQTGQGNALRKTLEFIALRKDRSEVPVELSLASVQIKEKWHAVGIIRDITERKQAEESLLSAHQRLLDTIESLPDATFIIDQNRCVIAWNRACEQLTGVPKEQLLGKGDYAYSVPFYGERRPMLIGLLDSSIAGMQSDYKYIKRIGDRIYAEGFAPPLNKGQGAYLWAVATALFDRGGKRFGTVEVVRDITERKQTEDALKESEHKFRAIIEQATEGIVMVDKQGFICEWNLACEKITGVPRDRVLGKSYWGVVYQFLLPERRTTERYQMFKDATELALNSGCSPYFGQVLEAVIVTESGERRSIQQVSFLVKTDKGNLMGVIVRDMTEPLKAEKALRDTEEKLRNLVENAPFGISLSTLDGRFIRANPAMARIFGYATEQQMVAEITDAAKQLYVNPALRTELFGQALSTRQYVQAETEFYRKDRSKGVANLYLRIVRSEKDEAEYVEGFLEDITVQKKAALELAHQKSRLETASKAARVALWALDLQTQVLEWSEVVDEMLGYGPGEYTRNLNGWADTIHPDDRARVVETLEQHLKNGTTYVSEYRVRKKDGTYTWWHDAGACLSDASGKQVEMFGACIDITDQKEVETAKTHLEEQLRQTQKLEAIGTLAGGIAHDFNNILGAIICNTELALRESQSLPDVQEELVDVLKAGERAKELVRQILAFSRQTKQERKPLALHVVTKEALKLLRSTLPATIEMSGQIAHDLPQVLADPTQIHQVLMNLCTNAAHAMRGKPGRLEVHLKPFKADEEFARLHPDMQPGFYVQMTINDTGHGMDTETMEHIFEPFFTTKGPGEGTGLGLSVVHGIIKDHDGAIYVYSKPNFGTTFQLYFPALITEVAPPKVENALIPRGKGENILFVDDEPDLCVVANRILSKLGYHVTTQTNPHNALVLFSQDPARFAVVITDLTMPGMTGIDLAKALFALRPGLPVVLASGFSGTYTEDKVLGLGLCALVQKPVTTTMLSQAVAQALHKTQYREKGVSTDITSV